MFKLFGGGKKKQQRDPTPQEAIQKLRGVEEILNKKQEFYEAKVQAEVDLIRQHGTKNKRLSLQALKRKKRLEKQLEQIDGTLTQIEYQREALENASTNTEVLTIMGIAARALKGAQLDIDQVQDTMDDIQEQQQLAQEISTLISSPAGQDTVDDDDLLAELEELEQMEVRTSTADRSVLPDLPEVPSGKIGGGRSKEDEDELAELASWAT